jgi:hypothetical protein
MIVSKQSESGFYFSRINQKIDVEQLRLDLSELKAEFDKIKDSPMFLDEFTYEKFIISVFLLENNSIQAMQHIKNSSLKNLMFKKKYALNKSNIITKFLNSKLELTDCLNLITEDLQRQLTKKIVDINKTLLTNNLLCSTLERTINKNLFLLKIIDLNVLIPMFDKDLLNNEYALTNWKEMLEDRLYFSESNQEIFEKIKFSRSEEFDKVSRFIFDYLNNKLSYSRVSLIKASETKLVMFFLAYGIYYEIFSKEEFENFQQNNEFFIDQMIKVLKLNLKNLEELNKKFYKDQNKPFVCVNWLDNFNSLDETDNSIIVYRAYINSYMLRASQLINVTKCIVKNNLVYLNNQLDNRADVNGFIQLLKDNSPALAKVNNISVEELNRYITNNIIC